MNFVRKSFTLIELLVAVFVFVILFLITASFVNLAAGSAKSLHIKMLTNDIRNAMDIINQKMNSANEKVELVPMSPKIYGFNASSNILGAVSKTAAGKKCTFFTKTGVAPDFSLSMLEWDNCTAWPGLADADWKAITGKGISVTDFTAAYSPSGWLPTSSSSPTVTVTIKAKDKDPKYEADNTIEIKTTYTMDFLTIKQLQ